ncbi:hypothetical protein ACH4GE_36860 [Streptomyces tendae]|uniref:hypothetical protein n=1 Tax=Streptomyces tendae TaxID=1932 RepID=UPI0037A9A921
MNRHLRRAVTVAAAVTAAVLMTACQNDSTDASSAKDTKVVGNAAAQAPGGEGVTGTFKGGEVTFLAPGKYVVTVPGEEDQQFMVADDTEVSGAGTICGEAGAKVDAPCTLDDLEAATKDGAVNADVDIKEGVATLVAERRDAEPDSDSGSDGDSREGAVEGIDEGNGVSGTWLGQVSYLAPGKYTVSDMKGVEQEFLLSEDTRIWGYGDICGTTDVEEGGEGGIECTETELEAAAQEGVSAEVVISNGIATSVRDDH